MVDVIYSSDNVTVLGGPSRLDLDLNIGATGQRGSLIFADDGSPSTNPDDFPVPPLVYDLYIDSDPQSSNYLQAYQYVNEAGSNIWATRFKLSQNIVSLNKVASFISGQATLDINLTELGLDTLPFDSRVNSFAYFNVQATISNVDVSLIGNEAALLAAHLPASLSVLVLDVYDDVENPINPDEFPAILPLKLTATEYNGSTWAPIDEKDVMVHLSITFANPNEILNFEGAVS